MRARSCRTTRGKAGHGFIRRGQALALLALGAALCGAPECTRASSYHYKLRGVVSNLLVRAGTVYFAQADGTLTALDLETGAVRGRGRYRSDGNLLEWASAGILRRSRSEAVLLDPATLDPLWYAPAALESVLSGDSLVSHDGWGTVACRDAATGWIRWTYHLARSIHLSAAGGRMLVHRWCLIERRPDLPALVLLDLATGQEVFRQLPHPVFHYVSGYLDDERVYALLQTTGGTDLDSPRDSTLMGFRVWDHAGRELPSLPVDPAPTAGLSFDEHSQRVLTSGRQAFAGGRAWPDRESLPPEYPGKGEKYWDPAWESMEDPFRLAVGLRFAVSGGTLTVRTVVDDTEQNAPDAEIEVTASLETSVGRWERRIPFLWGLGRIVRVASAGRWILLGSNQGHVACVDAADGRLRWLYLFPGFRHALICGLSIGGGRDEADAANFRQDRLRAARAAEQLVGQAAGGRGTRLILDPQPAGPYRLPPRQGVLIRSGWSLALLLGLWILLVMRRRGPKNGPQAARRDGR